MNLDGSLVGRLLGFDRSQHVLSRVSTHRLTQPPLRSFVNYYASLKILTGPF